MSEDLIVYRAEIIGKVTLRKEVLTQEFGELGDSHEERAQKFAIANVTAELEKVLILLNGGPYSVKS